MNNVEIVHAYRAALAAGDAREVKRCQSLIVTQNQGLVRRLVMRFVRPQSDADAEDAMQAGSMGLLRALEDYDPAKSSFSTYAAHWIRDHMQRWGGKATVVTRPRSALMPASIARAAALFRMKHGKEPSASDLGVTEAQLAEWSEGTHLVYLDEDVTEEHGRTELTNDAAEEEHTADRMALEKAWQAAVEDLPERNVQIAEAVLWNGETTVAVAERFGISQPFVTQICQRVEERLRRAVARASDAPDSTRLLGQGPKYVRKHVARIRERALRAMQRKVGAR